MHHNEDLNCSQRERKNNFVDKKREETFPVSRWVGGIKWESLDCKTTVG